MDLCSNKPRVADEHTCDLTSKNPTQLHFEEYRSSGITERTKIFVTDLNRQKYNT